MARIGFIGLGNMGGPMVGNLLKAGHELVVHDLVPEAVERAVEAGAARAETAAEAVTGATLVISMLPAGHHVRGLYTAADDDGQCLLDRIAAGTVVVDCSTIDADTAREVAAAAKERGVAMLDAPVSGGVGGAEAGTLTFMVGGEADAVEQARPILDVMGKAVFHAGPNGAGQVAKICNNLLLAVAMTGTAEALQLGASQGLDPAVLSEIMKQSSGSTWALQVYNPWPGVMENVPSSRGYQGGFLVDLMLKDLGLALDSASATDSRTPMGALARQLYLMHKHHGAEGRADAGGLDFSSILRLYQDEER